MDEQVLSREAIVTEARAMLGEVGLNGISLRKLAARVGVRAPSLYWYFKDKNALLEGMLEQIFNSCLDAMAEHRHWRDWMRAFGQALLRTQAETPDFGRLTTTTALTEACFSQTMARIREKLSGLDMPLDAAVELQSAVQALITGWSDFAHAPYAGLLRREIDLEDVALRSLDALIAGWSWEEQKSW